MAVCAQASTTSTLPFIGMIDDRVGVMTGGNGAAAKSSDEIGQIGAKIIASDTLNSKWDYEFPAKTFEVKLRARL